MHFDSEIIEADCLRNKLDVEFLLENSLSMKNYLMDQAGLLKALELKTEQLKKLENENNNLKNEIFKIKDQENALPFKIEELEENLEALNNQLKSQELINQQVKFNNEANIERNIWNIEKKNNLIRMNQKDRQILTLKSMYQQLNNEKVANEKIFNENIRQIEEDNVEMVEKCNKKIEKLKKKVKRLRRIAIKKCLEQSVHRKKYKLLKRSLKKLKKTFNSI